MSTTLKNILERYAWLEKEFRAIHKEIAEAQKILVDGEDESPIVQEFFDLTLDKQEVLVKPGRRLLQTPMLSFTKENGRFVAEPKELIVRQTRGPPAGSVNQPKRVCFSDLVFPPASSSQLPGSESARMIPSLLSGLSSVVPAVVAPEIPTVSSEPSPCLPPCLPLSLFLLVLLSKVVIRAMNTCWLVEKLPLALLILPPCYKPWS